MSIQRAATERLRTSGISCGFVFTQTDNDVRKLVEVIIEHVFACLNLRETFKSRKLAAIAHLFLKFSVPCVRAAMWQLQVSVCATSNSVHPLLLTELIFFSEQSK